MGTINVGRVVLGGLLAGAVLNAGESVLNVVVVGDQLAQAVAALNLPPIGPGSIAWFVVIGFVMGIALVWLYAALRPRFGPGPRTAVLAGLTVWFFGWLIVSWSQIVMGLFPVKLHITGVLWGLIEVPVSAVAGAWLYREGTAGGAVAQP